LERARPRFLFFLCDLVRLARPVPRPLSLSLSPFWRDGVLGRPQQRSTPSCSLPSNHLLWPFCFEGSRRWSFGGFRGLGSLLLYRKGRRYGSVVALCFFAAQRQAVRLLGLSSDGRRRWWTRVKSTGEAQTSRLCFGLSWIEWFTR